MDTLDRGASVVAAASEPALPPAGGSEMEARVTVERTRRVAADEDFCPLGVRPEADAPRSAARLPSMEAAVADMMTGRRAGDGALTTCAAPHSSGVALGIPTD
jgi:hypothetical protein